MRQKTVGNQIYNGRLDVHTVENAIYSRRNVLNCQKGALLRNYEKKIS